MEEVNDAPKREHFGVRELCSRFCNFGLRAKIFILLVAHSSKATAEPPHSKIGSPAWEPGFEPWEFGQMFQLVCRGTLWSRFGSETGLKLARGVIHRKPRQDNDHAKQQAIHAEDCFSVAFN
jgi:hypothetical protein